uniref:Signal induced proliferation associated 1 like 2 n=1 Tax=Pygocentrus nattereri TaxID=42514 RepID=A0AAR2IUN7_PYGNA
MQSGNPFARKLQTLDGNMGPPVSNIQGPPAVPKMGVRARVSDWPQRKDSSHGSPPIYDSLMSNFQNRIFSQDTDDVINQNQESPNKTSFLEAKYGLLNQSSSKGFHPLQKRSNSDITISDIDVEDVDQTAINPNTGASLHRDYGSTSSVDRQGLPSEGFFTTSRTHPPGNSEQPSAPPPHGFPEYLQYDTISPSLQTAAQIAQGVCIPNSSDYVDNSLFYSQERERSFLQRQKSEKGETSVFHKLKTMKSEPKYLTERDDCSRHGCTLSFQRCFAHYDVQSVLFNVTNRSNLACRKNITTGASAASKPHMIRAGDSIESLPVYPESPLGNCEDLGQKACTDLDEGDGKSNNMVLSCPYFRNELGGEGEWKLGLIRTNSITYSSGGENCTVESTLSSHCTNAGVSVLEFLHDDYSSHENYAVPRDYIKRYVIEHIDMGAYYYYKFFYNKGHQNYFGLDENLGPVAVSVRRERLEESKEGVQYNYRVIFRNSELTTLRGSILEDAVPSTAKHGSARGLPLKDVLEYVVPDLNIQCLRLAINSPKVSEQLLKLDQQGLGYQHKVGILYCRAGQSTEEEMYNNESGSPALEEFLDLLGQRVRLKGFNKYRAQLDDKTDSTGTHSLYTVYKDYELMFHVSTMLPYTPNNRQQLLRKRHIGNDIVTLIFQEPGALPFSPKNICSHFQHVFIIVKVHNPCTEHVCYSVAVTRSKDVPAFGPSIPKGVMFPKSAVFRDFLLAKVINGENAAHKSEKFRAMATRTRQEYLKDLAENFASATPVDSSAAKFSFITLGAKRKERSRPRVNAQLHSTGAITWAVVAQDCRLSTDVGCLLAISREFVVLIEESSKEVVFNCNCKEVIGWSSFSAAGRVKLFYERGYCVVFSIQDGCAEEVREVTQRLEIVTRGCETVEMVLRRNALGQLGFHVNFEGVVADVEPFGFAWQAGLRPGSRLVEICKVTVATLSHEQMIELLRTSTNVSVVVVQPHEDGTPRRACSELCSFTVMEYKTVGAGAGWHRMMHVPQGPPVDRPSCGQQMCQCVAIPRSTSFDKKYQDGTRILHDFELVQSSTGNPSLPYCSSPSNQSTSSDPGPCGTWSQKVGYNGCQSPAFHDQAEGKQTEGYRVQESRLDWARSAASFVSEAKWHIPSTRILNRDIQKQEIKDLPIKFPQVQKKNDHSHCSSHSSSNTLSSNASSSSDDKRFGSEDPMDPATLTYIKGASTDSGIDTTPCMPAPPPLPLTVPDIDHVEIVPRSERGQAGFPSALEDQEEEEREGDREKILMQAEVSAAAVGHVTDGSPGNLKEHISSNEFRESFGFWFFLSLQQIYRIDSSQLGGADGKLKTLSKEGFPKILLPVSLPGPIGYEKKFSVSQPSRRPLYRTLSDERLYSTHQRALSFASLRSSVLEQVLPNDILFSSALPYHSTLPPYMGLSHIASQFKNELWSSDNSLADRAKLTEADLMPLLDTTSGLNWSQLVDTAQAFKGMDGSPALLSGKVNQLEIILRQLQHDLKKEQQDKAMLQEQVQHLRQDNLRLHEESQTAAAQLRRFTEWFLNSVDKKV